MNITAKNIFGQVSDFRWDEAKIQRYRRHVLLPEFGIKGQERISSSSVLVVGAGGLGSPVIIYLASAGIGKIGIVDGDVVDLSNLQRQVLFSTSDVGKKKADVVRGRIEELNPYVQVEIYDSFLIPENAESIISQYDFVCECSDNYDTKLLVNDTCVHIHKPFTIGSLSAFEGQLFTHTEGTACWRCLYGAAPPSDKNESGVLGTVPGVVGSLEATEAIKFVTGTGQLLTNRLLKFNALNMDFNVFDFSSDPNCEVCGHDTVIEGQVARI